MIDPSLPIDPEIRVALEEFPSEMLAIGVEPGGIARFREQILRWLPTDDDLADGGTIRVRHQLIPRPSGLPAMKVVILEPASPEHSADGRSIVFAIHGGGMIIGDRRTDLSPMLPWVRELGVVVVSVEYRLAPEHPYPAAIEDCYLGLRWLVDHAAELDVEPSRLIVAGVSAGGGLAACLSLVVRDRKGPRIAHQVLICPMLEDRLGAASRSMSGVPWGPISNATGWRALLGEAVGTRDVSPYAAAARADSLAGLPPAFLDVGSVDIFRDEVTSYAARFTDAGVPTELHVWVGGTHGFDQMVPDAEVSRAAQAAQLSYLRRALRHPEDP